MGLICNTFTFANNYIKILLNYFLTNLLLLFYDGYAMVTQYNQYNSEALFKKSLLAENVSKSTIKNYLSDLRHYFGWLYQSVSKNSTSENLDVIALSTVPTVKNYIASLSTNGIPEKTINRRLSTLRKFFSFSINQGWMNYNPAKKIENIHSELSVSESLGEFESFLKGIGLTEDDIKDRLDDIKEFSQL